MNFEQIAKKIKASMENKPNEFEAYNDYFGLCREWAKEDFKAGQGANRAFRGAVSEAIRRCAYAEDFTKAEMFNDLLFRSLLFGAPHYFEDYLQAVEFGKPLAKQFYKPRMHYLRRYVEAYQAILDGECDFLSISMPKRAGKLIEHDCPVLTPDGFKRHGDLQAGDYVYGISGKPVKVIYKHPDSYATHRVVFSNGEEILTSAEHEWLIYDKSKNAYVIYETQQMSEMGLKVGQRWRYVMPKCAPIDMPDNLKRKYNVPTELARRITIRKIEKLEKPVVGNCITVEGGVYRVGIHQILTHNSQLGLNFVNMLSGKSPDKSTLMEGSGDALVNSFYQGCLEYVRQPNDYHFYDIFPDSKLVQTNADTKIFNLCSPSRFPTVMCRSIDSTQVGLSEATNLLYLDDCVQGREEAKNRQRLDDKWEVISGDVIGRAIEGTPIVICGTRYSLYDPIGRLQEAMHKQEKRCIIIETPALDPVTDESNFEYMREGKKVFTTGYFREQRDMLSAEQFESEFQQQPFEAKGLLFPESQLNRFFELPLDKDPDAIITVCDTAEKGSDFVSMPIACIYGTDVYIIAVVFDDSPPNVTKPECAKAIIDNKVLAATFESNNAGEYYARDVNEILKFKGYTCNIRTKRTISNKQTRIEFASDNIIKNFYFLDPSKYERSSQYAQFMKQVTTYTRSGKVAHDDAPDSLSLLENEIRKLGNNKVEVFQRPF